MNAWKNKILAHLHDPPEKAYDFSKWHVDRATHYSTLLGLGSTDWEGKDADWTAAASDRLIFPDPSKVKGLGGGVHFKHPLSGKSANFQFPAEKDEASALLGDAMPAVDADQLDLRERLFVLWRCWMENASSQSGAAGAIPFLPADTRIADGSIWNHMSVVSALEGTRNEEDELRPAMLIFQIGPVQEFIAQARSTRDLWSGSYLLSWLAAQALKAVADEVGPDSIIFPNLRGQPLFDWLNRDILNKAFFQSGDRKSQSFFQARKGDQAEAKSAALIPNLPNQFLAVVRDDFDVESLVISRVNEEFQSIAESVWQKLDSAGHPPLDRDIWKFQVDSFLQTQWQLWPWEGFDETRELIKKIPISLADQIETNLNAAEAISHQDTRCYPATKERGSLGLLWSAHYALCQHRLDGRRTVRNFDAWRKADGVRERDALSGREEAVVDGEWLEKISKHSELKHLFRKNDRLGAINLIKRMWHLAYLDNEHDLKRKLASFDSVYAVAAGSWKAEVESKLKKDSEAWVKFTSFAKSARKASDDQNIMEAVPVPPAESERGNEISWLESLDAELLTQAGWADGHDPNKLPESIADARRELEAFLNSLNMREPSAYYAVIVLDGDNVGRWLSGEHNPSIGDLIPEEKREKLAGDLKDQQIGKKWFDSRRLVSPSFHLSFSEALSNFGLYAARKVVEAHHGQLIYSGGDDVLAMVPAEEAINCTVGLRKAFQGALDLPRTYPEVFAATNSEGFLTLKSPHPHEPSWPLIVPGPVMNVSAGIAVGHCKSPLQDLVKAAREAEKRAKNSTDTEGLARNAVAVTLKKRSGEEIQWGTKFSSAGLPLLQNILQLLARKKFSNGFPNRMNELLRRFDSREATVAVSEDLVPILNRESEWAWDQMENAKSFVSDRESFFNLYTDFANDLAKKEARLSLLYDVFSVASFLNRHRTI